MPLAKQTRKPIAAKKQPEDAVFVRDVVCGMNLPLAQAVANVTHHGTTYYFDSADCAIKFQADPASFLDPPDVR